jgi:hypothetical protein
MKRLKDHNHDKQFGRNLLKRYGLDMPELENSQFARKPSFTSSFMRIFLMLLIPHHFIRSFLALHKTIATLETIQCLNL